LEVKCHRMIFLRHYLVVHFTLPVKKLSFTFEFIWCRGGVVGKNQSNNFTQALLSIAL
jgi:hypothetical protein